MSVPLGDEKIEAGLMKQQIDPTQALDGRGRIEQPAPHHASHDEGDGHREEVDVAEQPLTSGPLIQQDRQQEADSEAGGEEQKREDSCVSQVNLEPGTAEQSDEIGKAHEGVVWKQALPGRNRGLGSPRDEPVDKNGYRQYRRGYQCDG